MAFDVDVWRAQWAPTPWTFRAGGHEYAARDVSVEVVADFFEAYRAAGSDAKPARRVLVRFLRRLFPGVFWWTKPDPVEVILKLPPAGIEATLADFFSWRQRVLKRELSTTTSTSRIGAGDNGKRSAPAPRIPIPPSPSDS